MACSQECVTLGARRACHQVTKLEILTACKMLALCRMRDVQTALMESCLQAIPMCRQGLRLDGTAPCLLLSLLGETRY